MNTTLNGKIALVTGGTTGIGLATAQELAAQGARVFITGRRQAELESAVATTGAAATGIRAKAAVRNFARSWALDLKDRQIRVNAVSPGPIRTPGLGGLVDDDSRHGLFHYLAAQVPLGRLGEPQEIGKAVAFLASDAASFINGIELFVDGGMAQV